MYAALAVDDVVVVSPLVATYALFALILAMNVMSRALITGVVLVVGGIVAIRVARSKRTDCAGPGAGPAGTGHDADAPPTRER